MEFKTNWIASDYVNASDFNRITDNIVTIHGMAESILHNFDIEPMDTVDVSYVPHAEYFNVIEDNLQAVNDNTFSFDLGEFPEYVDNGYPPDYAELNRLEIGIELIYKTLKSQMSGLNRVAFKLGSRALGNR